VYGPFLSLYKDYIQSRGVATAMVQRLTTVESINKFFSDSKLKCEGQSIESLLHMPMRRIPRYILLIKDMTKRSYNPMVVAMADAILQDLSKAEQGTKCVEIVLEMTIGCYNVAIESLIHTRHLDSINSVYRNKSNYCCLSKCCCA
jgi:hypothetical protein